MSRRRILLGGAGSWDYLVTDAAAPSRVHRPPGPGDGRGRADGKLLGEVTGIHGAHGTAIAERAGHGFATSGNDSSVVMFDLEDASSRSGKVHAAEDADAIIYDAPSNRVFTFNGDAHSSTVIDPVAGKLVTNIDLGGKPEYGVSAGDGKVYANLTDNGEVVEIDAQRAARDAPVADGAVQESCRDGDRRHSITGCSAAAAAA